MVAARHDLLPPRSAQLDAQNAFIGVWCLDRVSGLIGAEALSIRRLRIDERALHVELHFRDVSAARLLTAELNGDTVELRTDTATCTVQTLLEGDVLVWEIELQSSVGGLRVRRVMHSSKRGSQLVAERVDMNAEGTPIALRTEYWARGSSRDSDD